MCQLIGPRRFTITTLQSAGRYLAKDLGATVEARRTFRNGWQVGVGLTN